MNPQICKSEHQFESDHMKSPRHIHLHLTRIIAMLAALPTIFAVTACGSTSSANGGDDGLTKVTFMLS